MKEIFKSIWKGLVWLWRKVFPKKYRAIKPSGTVSLIAGGSSGIEPIFHPTYRRITEINIIKRDDTSRK